MSQESVSNIIVSTVEIVQPTFTVGVAHGVERYVVRIRITMYKGNLTINYETMSIVGSGLT